ncbi:MAG: hypothetical protein K0S79_534 [Nitrospira sp.]|jgi:hypothetical protein|nr:hypothetical protein [Nitrospira sp.]
MVGNQQKAAQIRKWINPNERITVQFDDQRDLSAEVTGCTDQLVSLSLDTAIPHMRQHVSLPLSSVEVSEDVSHYTRDPERPLKRERMMLTAQGKRPAVIY